MLEESVHDLPEERFSQGPSECVQPMSGELVHVPIPVPYLAVDDPVNILDPSTQVAHSLAPLPSGEVFLLGMMISHKDI